MKERPIIFSGPMVRAILEGRKTQTRRLYTSIGKWDQYDRLWVKETFQAMWDFDLAGDNGIVEDAEDAPNAPERFYSVSLKHPYGWGKIAYSATDEPLDLCGPQDGEPSQRKIPSIYMPRWASRINLEILSVTSEHLREIDEAGAKAEGFESVEDFKALWNEIHPKRPSAHWDKNPLVYVIEFRRLT